MSKITNIHAPQRKLQGVKCHLGLPTVKDHEHQLPFGGSYYYEGFEFYSLEYVKNNSTQGRFEPDYQSYLAPYYGCPYEYPGDCLYDCPGDDSPCEHIFEETISNEMNPDRFLSQLCNGCKTAPACDHDVKTSFTKKLVLGIHIQKRAFCPPSSSFQPSDCDCSFCRKLFNGDPNLEEQIISVHDLRFMGHPTEVDIHYHYSGCDYKKEGMQNLPGIYEGSGNNQVRFTCRLAKAINTALAENIRKTFISEACAVSVNTINHWMQREQRLHSEKHDEYSVKRKFSSNAVPQVSYDTFQIHSENHIFVFDKTGEKESLRAIYSEQEWNSMADLVSGTSWGSFDSSNVPRLLNLACDYLSCCTDVPPNIGAMILSDIYCWGEAGSIGEYSCLFRSMNQDEENREITREYSSFWAEYYAFFNEFKSINAKGGMNKAFYLAMLRVLFNTDKAAESYNLSSLYRNALPSESNLRKPAERFHSVSEDRSDLFSAIEESQMPLEDILARILYFNPLVLPHEEPHPDSPLAFTANGDFDYFNGFVSVPSLEQTVLLIDSGILSDDNTVPVSSLYKEYKMILGID